MTASPDEPADLRARVSALERRMEVVAADATAARHIAAMNDRDYSDVAIKVDANRSAINALGVQTADSFEQLERKVDDGFAEMRAKFSQVHDGFAEMRAKFDQTAAGQQRIVELITGLVERGDDR